MILSRQIDLYARSLEPLERIRRLPPIATIRLAILVNFPEWLAYNDRLFPIGSEGALVFGGHLLPGMLFRANAAVHPDVIMVQADTPFHRPRGYAFQVSGRTADPIELIRWIQQGDLIFFTVYEEKGPHTGVLMKSGLRWEDLGVAFMGGHVLRRAHAQRCASTIHLYLEMGRSSQHLAGSFAGRPRPECRRKDPGPGGRSAMVWCDSVRSHPPWTNPAGDADARHIRERTFYRHTSRRV